MCWTERVLDWEGVVLEGWIGRVWYSVKLEGCGIGIVQDWKSVGLEECKIGKMQNWKGVRLQECKIGKVGRSLGLKEFKIGSV